MKQTKKTSQKRFLFLSETLPRWQSLLSLDCDKGETIAKVSLFYEGKNKEKNKLHTAYTDCCMHTLRDVHRQTLTPVHVRTHRESQRGYWCEWLSRGQGRDWRINWGSLFHTGESIKCHVTAMPWGVTGKQYPKCAERKAAESEKEREIKAGWSGGALLSAVSLISSLQLPQTPLHFCLSRHRSSTLPFRTPFRKHAGEPRLSWLSIVFLLSCCFTLGLVLPERDGIPAFLSLWSLIRACSRSWVSVTALSPPLRARTHISVRWTQSIGLQRPTVHCRVWNTSADHL